MNVELWCRRHAQSWLYGLHRGISFRTDRLRRQLDIERLRRKRRMTLRRRRNKRRMVRVMNEQDESLYAMNKDDIENMTPEDALNLLFGGGDDEESDEEENPLGYFIDSDAWDDWPDEDPRVRIREALYEYEGETKNDVKPRNLLAEFPDQSSFRVQGKQGSTITACVTMYAPGIIKVSPLVKTCMSLLNFNMESLRQENDENCSLTEKAVFLKRDARLLVINDRDTMEFLGFALIRIHREDDAAVLYIHELHIVESFKGCGIGRRVFALLERVACYWSLDWVMLTCYKNNTNAYEFYKKMGCIVDETGPSFEENESYVILSKKCHSPF